MGKPHRNLALVGLVAGVVTGVVIAGLAPVSAAEALGAGQANTAQSDNGKSDNGKSDNGKTHLVTGQRADTSTARKPKARKSRIFRVSGGPTFNSATGPDRAKYAINNKLKAAIDHTHRGAYIRIMSWNVMSAAATSHLLAAQRRGVVVRVLMDATNWSREVPNPQFKRLKYGLAAGNKKKYAGGYSAAKVCHGSCRGKSGSAHSKYYLFSKTGATRQVLMEGSANFTLAAATNQWNDIYTFVGPKFYNFSLGVFNQMWKDKAVRNPWVEARGGSGNYLGFSPDSGKNYHGHPVMNVLNQTSCRGATHTASHRTKIRIFPDVMRGGRGLAVAKRLKKLWNWGCDVKVGYTVLSKESYGVLRSKSGRGPVPLRHMAADNDGDGQFDLYFHLKVLTVNGVIGNNKGAYRMVQGSANQSGLSSQSDENQALFTSKSLTLRYQKHLDYWYAHPPISRSRTMAAARFAAVAPMDLTGLGVLASQTFADPLATGAYIAPGTKVVNPKTGELVDPYAHIDED